MKNIGVFEALKRVEISSNLLALAPACNKEAPRFDNQCA
jgi:hypothetical protein